MKQKEMGIVRDIDNTGRIVIPKEIRRVLDLKAKDSVEIIPRTDGFLIRKFDKKHLVK